MKYPGGTFTNGQDLKTGLGEKSECPWRGDTLPRHRAGPWGPCSCSEWRWSGGGAGASHQQGERWGGWERWAGEECGGFPCQAGRPLVAAQIGWCLKGEQVKVSWSPSRKTRVAAVCGACVVGRGGWTLGLPRPRRQPARCADSCAATGGGRHRGHAGSSHLDSQEASEHLCKSLWERIPKEAWKNQPQGSAPLSICTAQQDISHVQLLNLVVPVPHRPEHWQLRPCFCVCNAVSSGYWQMSDGLSGKKIKIPKGERCKGFSKHRNHDNSQHFVVFPVPYCVSSHVTLVVIQQ